MTDWRLWLAILALAGVTVLTRGVFLLPRRRPQLPAWLEAGLRHAPLAALMAVVVPEVLRTTAPTATGWLDPRWLAVGVAVACYCWRRGVGAPVVAGTVTLLLLRGCAG